MKATAFLVTLTGATLLACTGALAVGNDAVTSLHPEEAIPDDKAQGAPSQASELIARVQQRLRDRGFDPGPADGHYDEKTQAAIAQFQLSWPLPVNGMLDATTLAALGVEP